MLTRPSRQPRAEGVKRSPALGLTWDILPVRCSLDKQLECTQCWRVECDGRFSGKSLRRNLSTNATGLFTSRTYAPAARQWLGVAESGNYVGEQH
jgi:hypothetical protein